MEFPEGKEAGWHVLIGDNGAGKSTVLKAIALGLLRLNDVDRLNQDWNSWVRKGKKSAEISVVFAGADKKTGKAFKYENKHRIDYDRKGEYFMDGSANSEKRGLFPINLEGETFAVAFGPFRRFTGGDPTLGEKGKETPVSPFATLFWEGLALTSTLAWIKDAYLRSLEKQANADLVMAGIESVLSSKELLPEGIRFDRINADGVFFLNSNNKPIRLHELSDGMKSVLALTLEMLRRMLNIFNPTDLFKFDTRKNGNGRVAYAGIPAISVPGIVLIDEVDAHLHPSWQTRIGYWFTNFFPNVQFIVSTHSPLICRACENGSIWRLASPGSAQQSGEIAGIQRRRLIYGNVLDAFGTQVFGEQTSRSEEGTAKMKRLAELNIKSVAGRLSPEEESEYMELQTIFPTAGK